jgi:hypothetical protein
MVDNMKELDELLEALEAWEKEGILLYQWPADIELREAYRAYKAIPKPLVLEAVDFPLKPNTQHFVVNGVCYRLSGG